jgi:hypothetical protein
VASHIFFKIAWSDSPVKEEQVAPLLRDLENYLAAEAPTAERVVRFLLWPFYWAKQLVPFRTQPRRFLAAVQSLADSKSIDRYLNINNSS